MIVVDCCGENGPDAAKILIFWRPRRDLNPCYRRESTAVSGKLLKSCDTNGYQRELQNRLRTLLEPNSCHNWTIIGPRKLLRSACASQRTILPIGHDEIAFLGRALAVEPIEGQMCRSQSLVHCEIPSLHRSAFRESSRFIASVSIRQPQATGSDR
jgi:hypothetical protein